MICKVLDMGELRRRLLRLDYEKAQLPYWLYTLVGIDWNAQNPFIAPYDQLKQTLATATSSAQTVAPADMLASHAQETAATTESTTS